MLREPKLTQTAPTKFDGPQLTNEMAVPHNKRGLLFEREFRLPDQRRSLTWLRDHIRMSGPELSADGE